MTVQPVQWIVQFKDGTKVREFEEDGKETVFTEIMERKNEMKYLALSDMVNGILYSVNLENGAFILGGQEFSISKEIDGRVFQIPESCDFANGVIQFKCSKPMIPSMRDVMAIQAQARTYNIGYKVDLPEGFSTVPYGKGFLSIIKCQALLSIDADTMRPSISTTFTSEITAEDGKKLLQRI